MHAGFGTCLYLRLETNWLDNFKLWTEVDDLLGSKYSNKQKLWTPCKPVIIYIASLGYHNNDEASRENRKEKRLCELFGLGLFSICAKIFSD